MDLIYPHKLLLKQKKPLDLLHQFWFTFFWASFFKDTSGPLHFKLLSYTNICLYWSIHSHSVQTGGWMEKHFSGYRQRAVTNDVFI